VVYKDKENDYLTGLFKYEYTIEGQKCPELFAKKRQKKACAPESCVLLITGMPSASSPKVKQIP
jgi:hypothetical protein